MYGLHDLSAGAVGFCDCVARLPAFGGAGSGSGSGLTAQNNFFLPLDARHFKASINLYHAVFPASSTPKSHKNAKIRPGLGQKSRMLLIYMAVAGDCQSHGLWCAAVCVVVCVAEPGARIFWTWVEGGMDLDGWRGVSPLSCAAHTIPNFPDMC